MALNASNRTRYQAMADELLPDDHIRALVVGRAGAEPVAASLMLAVFLVVGSIGFYVLTGGYFILGLLVVLAILHFVSPPRAVAICDDQVVLIKRSFWRARPSTVASRSPLAELAPMRTSASRVRVSVGAVPVWFTKGEESILRRTVAMARTDLGPVAHEDSEPAVPGPHGSGTPRAAAARDAAVAAGLDQATPPPTGSVSGTSSLTPPATEPLASRSVPSADPLRAVLALADLPADAEIEPAVLKAADLGGSSAPHLLDGIPADVELEPAVRRAIEEARRAGELPIDRS
ncbi:MAG: hypothetical protein JWM89_4045 [Acidimicrobiales bacterium]|nr:hypothetical protein [Acidimicrobiales bacterium]